MQVRLKNTIVKSNIKCNVKCMELLAIMCPWIRLYVHSQWIHSLEMWGEFSFLSNTILSGHCGEIIWLQSKHCLCRMTSRSTCNQWITIVYLLQSKWIVWEIVRKLVRISNIASEIVKTIYLSRSWKSNRFFVLAIYSRFTKIWSRDNEPLICRVWSRKS